MLLILRVKSSDSINALFSILKSKPIHATIIDSKMPFSLSQIEGAYELSKRSTKEGKAISERIEIEFLLWLSSEMHVNKAIEKVGAKNTSDMLLVVFDAKESEARKLARECGFEIIGKFEPNKASEKEQKLLLEKMAISRLV